VPSFNPYASGVLDPDVHEQLVSGLSRYARLAGVPKRMICETLSAYCSAKEIEWVSNVHSHATCGLVYVGAEQVETRMMALIACLLRNFVDARYLTGHVALAQLKDTGSVANTVIAIPDFFISKAEGGTLAPWNVNGLLGLLHARAAEAHQTIIGVSNIDTMSAEYGTAFKTFVLDHYQVIRG